MELQRLESLAGQKIRVIDLSINVNFGPELIPQAMRLFDQAKEYENDLRRDTVWVNLPAQSSLAAIVVIYLSKWLGRPPMILRTRPMTMGLMFYNEIIEIIDLAKV